MSELSISAERPRTNSRRKLVVSSGDRYGRLTVIREVEKRNGVRCCEVQCECGSTKVVILKNLLRGTSRSCGCLQRQLSSERATTHGSRKTPLYEVWAGMIQRCTNDRHRSYHRYGGRGISVCEAWRESTSFLSWAKANGWKPGLQIDRRDNDGDYTPENCRFVTQTVNARNTARSHMITHDGKTQCLSAWSEETGISRHVIRKRIDRGWSVERALTERVN